MKLFTLTLAACLSVVFGFFAADHSCHASIVFDNGDHLGNGRLSSFGFYNADDFSFAADTTITDVHWKGFYGPGVPSVADDFTIRIFADAGGYPTAPVLGSAIYTSPTGTANRTPSGDPDLFGTYTIYSYSATITPFVALAGTDYWLSIYNNETNDEWYWSMDTDIGNSVESFNGVSWVREFDANNFQLTNDGTGTVPEPLSLMVWVGLIAATAVSTGRRKRS